MNPGVTPAVKTVIPHLRVVETHDDFSPDRLDDVLRRAVAASRQAPVCIEVADAARQHLVFLREGQVYAAGSIEGQQFESTTVRDFLTGATRMSFPTITWYSLNAKLLHSLLMLFQKKLVLRVLTSLVDLDEVLDRIESEGKSCIVSASREHFLALLRYEKGRATALGHEASVPVPRESTFREEFLVKIYTISAEQPLTVSLHEDLLVTYAADARAIPDDYDGRIDELFLTRPPIVSLQFKGREVDHWVFDRPQLRIGRTPDNDIVIDNLAVSRLHAVLEQDKGEFYVRDCDSLNGTLVNGRRVGRARLEDGDEIVIGKHSIVFRRQGGRDVAPDETMEGFDQTVIIDAARPAATPAPSDPPGAPSDDPRLVRHTDWGERIIRLDRDHLVIGRGVEADVSIDGLFVARRHAEIVREDGRVVLRHVGGLRGVRVGGRRVREVELHDNDEIRIAGASFVFHE